MTIAEAATQIRNQSPNWAQAYLWTFVAFCILCLILGFIDHRKELRCFFIKCMGRKSS